MSVCLSFAFVCLGFFGANVNGVFLIPNFSHSLLVYGIAMDIVLTYLVSCSLAVVTLFIVVATASGLGFSTWMIMSSAN